MANMIMNSARFILFGTKLDSKVSLENIAKRKAANVGRRALGLPAQSGPGLRDWLWQVVKDELAAIFGSGDKGPRLPDGLPVELFMAVDNVLRNRGGLANKDLNLPNFWLNVQGATSTPFFWSMVVDYAPAADISKIATFESAIEDAITRKGFDYNVRIQNRPTRIEIDKPEPPRILLSTLWPDVMMHKVNDRNCLLGQAYVNGRVITKYIRMDGEDSSAFVSGRPGSGKTQLTINMLLTMAAMNGPDYLSMVIIDPKGMDFRPFTGMPHLAVPVINDAEAAAEILQILADEMTRRTKDASNKFLAHNILVYVDEISDMLDRLPKEDADRAAMNINRLGQLGRAMGIIMIGATQRTYDVPEAAHGKLAVRLVGRARNASDSVAASGLAGTTAHKLPGKGSFEVYSTDDTGLRIQAPFVADSKLPTYAKNLQPFFDDIKRRWGNERPGWVLPGKAETSAPEVKAEEQSAPTKAPTVTDPAFVSACLSAIRLLGVERFSARTVRDIHKRLYGTEPRNDKATRLREEFIATHATEIAGF